VREDQAPARGAAQPQAAPVRATPVLRCGVLRPVKAGRAPVTLTYPATRASRSRTWRRGCLLLPINLPKRKGRRQPA
jgi:hypothetical protein